ncbi:MAG: hypothetical protein KGZ33_00505 [Alkaliphilus sp.]|nr:hypothetical protein [Alkaliphilus sp.]
MYYDALIVPLIIGITELAKRFGLPKKYAAIFSWILGLVFAYIYVSPNEMKELFIVGSALGLSASGLFSGTKSITKRK